VLGCIVSATAMSGCGEALETSEQSHGAAESVHADGYMPSQTCSDVPPSDDYSCAQQAAWGKCNASWMVGHCDKSCGRCDSNDEPPSYAFCNTCSNPKPTGYVSGSVTEASGLVASKRHPGFYYVHNDSGDAARFFAIDESGNNHGRYNINGATATDWEDASLGPCDNTSCLYVGDVGDNAEKRNDYRIYRIKEPGTLSAGDHWLDADVLPFTYPDGSHNCETLMVHPTSGDIFVITKKGHGAAGIYQFPAITPGATVVLKKLGKFHPPTGDNRITAGDMHPLGIGLLLRSYTKLFYYALDETLAPAAAIAATLTKPGCSVPVAYEKQGETVAWRLDGKGWLTVSEGHGQAIHRVGCQ